MEHDHSSHGGHSMPMPPDTPMCSMNMLWNNDIENVCVVFSSWHIYGPFTMALSCLAIALISIFYAYLLNSLRNFDRNLAIQLSTPTGSSSMRRDGSMSGNGGTSTPGGRGSLIPPLQGGYSAVEGGSGRLGVTKLPMHTRVLRAGMYAITVALSFLLMLVAMTYNTFLFFSIVIGAFVGHIMYESEIDIGSLSGDKKGLACH